MANNNKTVVMRERWNRITLACEKNTLAKRKVVGSCMLLLLLISYRPTPIQGLLLYRLPTLMALGL